MRTLAYANRRGATHPESAWITARMHTQGLTKEAAQAEINAEIAAGKIVVVEEK